MEQPTPALIDLLMALSGISHGQRCIHVHVVAGEVKADQALEEYGPSRKGGAEED